MPPQLTPDDEFNQTLVANAHPSPWQNPRPEGRYNLVAVGGGTAGIIAALGAAGLGGRAAIVERHLLGGDCLNYGCVPSKALLRCARAVRQTALGAEYGFVVDGAVRADFPAVMQRLRRLRAQISRHDSAQRFAGLGVDVFLGSAAFTGHDSLEVGGQTLRFARAVIATGGRAAAPALDGLAEVGYLTNETIFSLTELPRRLVVIGAGPVGCELAQAFRRFGSEVQLIGRGHAILPKEDPAAAGVVQAQLEREGVHLHLGWTTLRAERTGDSKSLLIERGGQKQKLIADEFLVAVGRRPNVEGLGLEAAGVAYTDRGVSVDDHLRTSNRAIFAAGDVCSKQKFTHAADAMARLCIQNALFLGRKRLSRLVIPRCTYTDPELAHVGLTPAEAAAQGVEIDSYRTDLKDVDRAIVDGEDQGFAVVHTRRGTGRVVGATIVAAHAGEMIAEVTLLLTRKLALGALAGSIHCYPTQTEALKRIADAYARTRLTPRVARLLKKWLAWRR
jgi:pyruvate/2-oxoglutarate dehydrogenase complex dihydrolipoamide dehydrogenase (E3) component